MPKLTQLYMEITNAEFVYSLPVVLNGAGKADMGCLHIVYAGDCFRLPAAYQGSAVVVEYRDFDVPVRVAGGETVDHCNFTPTPEPSTVMGLAIGMLLFGSILKLRYRKGL